MAEQTTSGETGWRCVVFQEVWPQGKDPRVHMDLLLAHKVIWPVLRDHNRHVELWKFHRRWDPRDRNHEFEFYFYSSVNTARNIYRSLRSDTLLRQMMAERLVEDRDDMYDDLTTNPKPNIEDMGECDWPLVLRNSWPYFIMGVSRMWLELIERCAGENPSSQASHLAKKLRLYKEVDQRMGRLWYGNGYQSLIHHLSLMFGCEPVLLPPPLGKVRL